nr:MAG TPA: hypothetical protein [Caudoviricetes sp.]
MSIASGFTKMKNYILTSSGYKLLSRWTSSQTVHMGDGTDDTDTVEHRFGAMKGVTSSLATDNDEYALSASAGKNLQDQCTQLNQSLTDIGECVILGQTSSTSESNQIELPDDINNYKLLILMYLSTDGDILNTNIVPIKYFKQTKYRVIAIWTNTSLGAFAKYIDDTHINLYVRTRYSAVLIGVK